jgi:murein DD-endopeptidase MepM/ murein hydrolase activator NlpD
MLSHISRLLLVLVLPLFILNESMAQTGSKQTKSGEVKKGQGLYQALKDVSIDNALALELINTLRDEVEFSKLKIGDKLEATFNQDKKLVEFAFSQNQVEKHVLKLNQKNGKWDYNFKEEKTFWFSHILEGSLNPGSTLQEDLLAQGLSPSVVNEVVNVLLLKVNFRMNARVGDRFKVLLSERKFKSSIIQTKVLYTSYKGNRAGFHEAYYFEDEEKSSTYTAHYTQDGQALISSGLRYPLSRLHVRSGFGWRRHPVTGRRAMHRGVDLRGRTGTPVHAVADGTVIEASYNQFAGNKIAIRHRDGSKSYYYHLARRSVKRGDWVRSFQIIGTVGATGRVTGPHLHFGFKTTKGSWMNPLNKRMIATPKLTGQRLRNLKEQISEIRSLMTDLEISRVAKYLLQDIPNLRAKSQFEWDFSKVGSNI